MRNVIVALVLLTVSVPPIKAMADPPVFTVDYVKAHIAALHGKTIRLYGELNNCESLTCSICTGGGTDAVCLGVSLWADSPASRRLVEELYRFANVTIDARVDATCEVHYDPSKTRGPKPGKIFVCTDRSTSIEDARVVSVDVRRAATDGRFDMYAGEPLRLATDEERKSILDGWRAWEKQFYGWREPLQVEVFMLAPKPEQDDTGVRLCVCLKDDCKGKWPSLSGQFVRSPANPYSCMRAEPYKTSWVFVQ